MCDFEFEIDWLTGAYTGREERIRREARRLGIEGGNKI